MKNIKLVMLIGKSGSGKDSIKKELVKNPDFHNIIGVTTRPKRDNESSLAYHFISKEEFINKLLNNLLLTGSVYNGWGYGIYNSELAKDKINIGVFNLNDLDIINQTNENHKMDIKVILVNCDAKERLLRQLYREKEPNVDEIIRRYSADEEEYKNFNFLELKNVKLYTIDNTLTLEDSVQETLKIINNNDWTK